MSEGFAVNGSLRNASTVDGEIFLSAAWRVLILNHPWDVSLPTALADDGHGNRSALPVGLRRGAWFQSVAVTDDIVALFIFVVRKYPWAAKITHFSELSAFFFLF